MKISKKKLLAIALTLTTFIATFAAFGPFVVSTEYIDVNDYCWIEGVLHDDTYALYPYAEESLDIGFSKYGEMIGYNEDDGIGLGLQYPGYESAADPDSAPDGTYDQRIDTSVDPFCNEYIGVNWWMNGWFLDIKYLTPGGTEREIWAMALFSDGVSYGGDWIIMPSVEATSPARPLWQEHPPYAHPDSDAYTGVITPIPERGGRKTNGYCETEPIEIIYNGPRKFIALTKTTVSDTALGTDLVSLTFTFIFNKAEKNVIILKDVKRLYTKQPLNVAFGNRGEWDLGIEGDTDSYTHWYTDEPVQYWDMNGNGDINGTEVATSFEFFKDYCVSRKHPKKWWDDVAYEDTPTTVFNEMTEAMMGFPEEWLETQPTCYGREWHMDRNIKEHSYAVAQVVSGAGDYVGALAVWPHPEFWSAANRFRPPTRTVAPAGNNPESIGLMLAPLSRMLDWHKWTVELDPNQGLEDDLTDRDDVWVKADDIRYRDGTTSEPIIPFIIYEHDFELSSTVPAYREVSVYTVTDCHDADDADADDPGNEETWSNGLNVIDREVQYQLDEIFDPWDIYDAMHKETKRWVQFFETDIDDHPWNGLDYYQIQLDSVREVESGDLIPSLPVYVAEDGPWDAYCSFSERVLVDTGTGYELIYPLGYQNIDPIPNEDEDSPYYTINRTSGVISFYEYDTAYMEWMLPEDSVVKVLWSSEHQASAADQWDENHLIYPVGNVTCCFPLRHDASFYKNVEVFLDGSPLLDGDYVFNNASKTVFTQYPVPAGQWLLVNYTVAGDPYANFFEGDGKKTEFVLQMYPDLDTEVVKSTEILERIENASLDPVTPTPGEVYMVPKEDCYWTNNSHTYEPATPIVYAGLRETEWLNVTSTLTSNDWIVHESPEGDYFSTCDELVLDDSVLEQADSELKVVFKVPSGRYEWAVVGEPAASVDVAGAVMTVAAFKNKLIEFGIGGLDVEDATYGPTVPWMVREDISPDAHGRYHLHDDWCYSRTGVGLDRSWPIASSNIITVGGPVPNMVTKYLNDYVQAMVFTNVGTGFYGVTCWDKALSEYGYWACGSVGDRYGYAVISTYKDKNGTVLFQIYGCTGQDTYYACKWFDEHKFELQHINLHVTDLVLRIEYEYSDGDPRCPPIVTIREKLGTISEKPQHDCP